MRIKKNNTGNITSYHVKSQRILMTKKKKQTKMCKSCNSFCGLDYIILTNPIPNL